jgi:geranylgeranyl reductase family protein
MPERCYEVAIIGAGPAGATLAYELRRAGLQPVLLDGARFPRHKVCAGGLTLKALPYLPPDIGAVLENDIYRVNLSFDLDRAFTKTSPACLLHTVDRRRFDAFLVDRVLAAGGVMREGERLEKLILAPGDAATLLTSRGRFQARVVVGADGARSLTARGAGLQPVEFWSLGLQVEVPQSLMTRPDRELAATISLDLGALPDGYAWVFPRGDLLVVGVGGPVRQGRRLKKYLGRVLAHLGVEARRLPLAAHLIPHRVSPRPLVRDQVLLVGDAAGLADYWTGEGIFFALQSARLAARQIIRFFQGQADALTHYQAAVDREITPELRTSYQFAKLFHYLGPLAFHCLRRYNYPWEVFCRIMRGERSFLETKKRFRPDIFWRKLLIKSARNRPLQKR